MSKCLLVPAILCGLFVPASVHTGSKNSKNAGNTEILFSDQLEQLSLDEIIATISLLLVQKKRELSPFFDEKILQLIADEEEIVCAHYKKADPTLEDIEIIQSFTRSVHVELYTHAYNEVVSLIKKHGSKEQKLLFSYAPKPAVFKKQWLPGTQDIVTSDDLSRSTRELLKKTVQQLSFNSLVEYIVLNGVSIRCGHMEQPDRLILALLFSRDSNFCGPYTLLFKKAKKLCKRKSTQAQKQVVAFLADLHTKLEAAKLEAEYSA